MTDIRDTSDADRLGADGPRGVALRVEQDRSHAGVVVRVAGDLDMATAAQLEAQLLAAEAAVVPPAPVVLDLTGVRFMSSSGLALLVQSHQRCVALGSPLRVVADNRAVLRPIELTGLDHLLMLVPTTRKALEP
jgi:anti-sigma B factor antagonist